MKNLLILLLGIAALSAYSQSTPKENEIYNLVIDYFRSNHNKGYVVLLNEDLFPNFIGKDSLRLAEFGTLLTVEDRQYMLQQAAAYNGVFTLKPHRVKLLIGGNLVDGNRLLSLSTTDYWQGIHDTYGEQVSIVGMSRPLFSKDGTLAVIDICIMHDGISGNNSRYLFRKGETGWEEISYVVLWTSGND
ncbi:hypothetical protein AM493_00745 [Flavobacterium akiainvivens]|uniref:SnoaL-like domain-containing protein n=1 Tax=Flavobacterium akiainvivens TaxID=1202724 RepID=A0A0M9VGQ9_9FLAO|nr:hypothetical protein [Flavobacterium akiainvivens]KOS04736.1 hypothetical protein AM493_00745 [Flavobacterium akiainvivens]SFQ66875.1 hypothetical protein SAMN05444144_11373 [Flavobacterium akiainvivens]